MAAAPVITGDREIVKLFEGLDDSMKKKALRPAAKKSTQSVVLPAARANLLDQQEGGTGALHKSLKVRAIKRSRVKVGSSVELRNREGRTEEFYGLFLEFGLTKTAPPRRHRKTGKSTGDLQPQPFLRPALYDNRARIRRKFVDSIRTWINTIRAGGDAKLANKAVRAA